MNTTAVSSAALRSIVDEVTSSMLGCNASHTDASAMADEREWTGTVEVGSPAELVVLVRCSRAWALDAAQHMLGEPTPSDVSAREVLAEVTSVVGGNIKSLVAELAGAPVCMPRVELGAGPHLGLIEEVRLQCGRDVITVSIHHPRAGGSTPCAS